MRHNRIFGFAATVLASLTAFAGAAVVVPQAVAVEQATPVVTAIRAAHHPGYDRVVFQFGSTNPARVTVGYVDRVVADASGMPVAVAGSYFLEVKMAPATSWGGTSSLTPTVVTTSLPNVRQIVRSGDFEAVLTYAIGLSQRVPVHEFTLSSPSRVVIDIPVLAWSTLQKGSAGSDVLAAQYMLRSHGYTLAADGIFGPVTASAVTAFQRSHGLLADGIVGPLTWSKLVGTVVYGATGDMTRALQVELDHNGAALVVDGIFGPMTKAAVTSWQARQWLAVDGIVGPMTWTSLVNHVSAS